MPLLSGAVAGGLACVLLVDLGASDLLPAALVFGGVVYASVAIRLGIPRRSAVLRAAAASVCGAVLVYLVLVWRAIDGWGADWKKPSCAGFHFDRSAWQAGPPDRADQAYCLTRSGELIGLPSREARRLLGTGETVDDLPGLRSYLLGGLDDLGMKQVNLDVTLRNGRVVRVVISPDPY